MGTTAWICLLTGLTPNPSSAPRSEPVPAPPTAPSNVTAPAPAAPAIDAAALRDAAQVTLRAAEVSANAADRLSELSRALKPAAEEDDEHWTFKAGLRLESVSGNAQSYTVGVDGSAEGQWGAWGTELKLGYALGRTRQARVPVANNGMISARGDRDFTPLLSTYVLAGGMFDRVASIHHQGYGEAGIGLTWLDKAVENIVYHRVRTSLGFRTTQEGRRDFYPEVAPPVAPAVQQNVIYAPSLTLAYRYRMNRHVMLSEDASTQFNLQNRRDVRANSDTGVNVQITDIVTVALVGKVRYIGSPAPGRQPTDTTLGSNITLSW